MSEIRKTDRYRQPQFMRVQELTASQESVLGETELKLTNSWRLSVDTSELKTSVRASHSQGFLPPLSFISRSSTSSLLQMSEKNTLILPESVVSDIIVTSNIASVPFFLPLLVFPLCVLHLS